MPKCEISIKLQSKFIAIALQHGCSLVNLPHIFRTPFPKSTFGWLLLIIEFITLITISMLLILSFFKNGFAKLEHQSIFNT